MCFSYLMNLLQIWVWRILEMCSGRRSLRPHSTGENVAFGHFLSNFRWLLRRRPHKLLSGKYPSTLILDSSLNTCWYLLQLQELLKCTVDLIDLIGLSVVMSRIAGKGHTKVLIAGLGWAGAELVLSRLLVFWVGARGTEFDWKYIQKSFEANISIVSLKPFYFGSIRPIDWFISFSRFIFYLQLLWYGCILVMICLVNCSLLLLYWLAFTATSRSFAT